MIRALNENESGSGNVRGICKKGHVKSLNLGVIFRHNLTSSERNRRKLGEWGAPMN